VRADIDSGIQIWHLSGEPKAGRLLRTLSAEPGGELWMGRFSVRRSSSSCAPKKRRAKTRGLPRLSVRFVPIRPGREKPRVDRVFLCLSYPLTASAIRPDSYSFAPWGCASAAVGWA